MVIKWAKWKCSCRSFWGNSIKDPAVTLKLRTKVEYSCVMQELRIFSHSVPWYWLLDLNFNGINIELFNTKIAEPCACAFRGVQCVAGKH